MIWIINGEMKRRLNVLDYLRQPEGISIREKVRNVVIRKRADA